MDDQAQKLRDSTGKKEGPAKKDTSKEGKDLEAFIKSVRDYASKNPDCPVGQAALGAVEGDAVEPEIPVVDDVDTAAPEAEVVEALAEEPVETGVVEEGAEDPLLDAQIAAMGGGEGLNEFGGSSVTPSGAPFEPETPEEEEMLSLAQDIPVEKHKYW